VGQEQLKIKIYCHYNLKALPKVELFLVPFNSEKLFLRRKAEMPGNTIKPTLP
jgi:hypothetical protein